MMSYYYLVLSRNGEDSFNKFRIPIRIILKEGRAEPHKKNQVNRSNSFLVTCADPNALPSHSSAGPMVQSHPSFQVKANHTSFRLISDFFLISKNILTMLVVFLKTLLQLVSKLLFEGASEMH